MTLRSLALARVAVCQTQLPYYLRALLLFGLLLPLCSLLSVSLLLFNIFLQAVLLVTGPVRVTPALVQGLREGFQFALVLLSLTSELSYLLLLVEETMRSTRAGASSVLLQLCTPGKRVDFLHLGVSS